MDEVHSMQEQMNKLNREREILRKDQKEMLEVKNPVSQSIILIKNFECFPTVCSIGNIDLNKAQGSVIRRKGE